MLEDSKAPESETKGVLLSTVQVWALCFHCFPCLWNKNNVKQPRRCMLSMVYATPGNSGKGVPFMLYVTPESVTLQNTNLLKDLLPRWWIFVPKRDTYCSHQQTHLSLLPRKKLSFEAVTHKQFIGWTKKKMNDFPTSVSYPFFFKNTTYISLQNVIISLAKISCLHIVYLYTAFYCNDSFCTSKNKPQFWMCMTIPIRVIAVYASCIIHIFF